MKTLTVLDAAQLTPEEREALRKIGFEIVEAVMRTNDPVGDALREIGEDTMAAWALELAGVPQPERDQILASRMHAKAIALAEGYQASSPGRMSIEAAMRRTEHLR